ncbi:MAG: aminomethyl transferase family protein [Solirubrobacterales bacterium]
MSGKSLQEKIDEHASPLDMLRNNRFGAWTFPMKPEFTNWRSEQAAWAKTAVVFDQGFHMYDINFRGPDLHRLLSDVAINSFDMFGKNKAKQMVVCNEDGYVIGDSILFGLDDEEASVVGGPIVSRWVEYQAEIGDYDVEITRDEMSLMNPDRKFFRWQLQGPNALKVADKASKGTLPEIGRFGMGEFTIAGRPVRALNHSMTRRMGLEIWGPAADGQAVLEALVAAGEEFGLLEAGGVAYSTTALESGWYGINVPAIYSGESMRPYREWVSAETPEGFGTIGGSYVPDTIDGHYITPWDTGYGQILNFDHDFIGRAALERLADRPHRKKVWLRWNDDDVIDVMRSSLFDDEATRAKFMGQPYSVYSTFPADAVYMNDELVGISTRVGYTVNVGSWSSLAMIDEERAVDGAEVSVLWGEPNGGTAKRSVERHAQRPVRAVVSTTSLA